MARTETVTITNMCMVYDGTRILVQDRMDPHWPGITFPGGHVEKGEPLADAVIREVYEETGLRISSPQLCGIKDWFRDDGSRYMVLCYKTNQFEGTLTSSAEGDMYWIELAEMKKMHIANGMDKMIEVFLKENVSEHFCYKENGEWINVLK